jgi:hypothetical protein
VPSAAQEPLGLMVGVAGIAYGCLRLADPVQVPSVLGLTVGALPSSPGRAPARNLAHVSHGLVFPA